MLYCVYIWGAKTVGVDFWPIIGTSNFIMITLFIIVATLEVKHP